MIVIGADTHKRSHTVAAVEAASGRMLVERTVPAQRRCFEALLTWARGHGRQRVWAIEDCRHVSGALERFLLAHGEAVVRVAPKLTVRERNAARERGKSDAIDAVAIARAALREGLDTLPVAQLAGPELDVRLLVDHRERLIAQRTALSNDLRWHLHDLWPETAIPLRALTATGWQTRIAARLGRAPQTARVRIARDELRRVRELTRAINELHAELGTLVAALAPRLLAERGCGVPYRRQAARRDRRRDPLRQRRQARPHRRHRAHPRIIRANSETPARPRRQPPDQLRAAPPRRHQRPPGP
jgi:transposase